MAKKIYVGNMSYRTTEDDLRAVFEEFGEVLSVNVILDRETKRPKGFAFVEMDQSEEADAAIAELDGKEVGGRMLRVNEATERPPRTDKENSYRKFNNNNRNR